MVKGVGCGSWPNWLVEEELNREDVEVLVAGVESATKIVGCFGEAFVLEGPTTAVGGGGTGLGSALLLLGILGLLQQIGG